MAIIVLIVATWAGLHGMTTLMNNGFEERLNASRGRVNKFAYKMWKLGVKMFMPPECLDLNYEKRWENADDGDLFVTMRVEHKVRRNIDFSCREDYPYPTVFVDEYYKIENKEDRPLCYVIENKEGSYCAVIYNYTKKHWVIEKHYDPIQQRICEFYAAPKSFVRFCKTEDIF
jgi:hypothetical protein